MTQTYVNLQLYAWLLENRGGGLGNILVMVIYRGGSQFFDQTCAALRIEPPHPAGGGRTCWFAWCYDVLPLLQPFSHPIESGFAVGML
jgi:hypothetical protein